MALTWRAKERGGTGLIGLERLYYLATLNLRDFLASRTHLLAGLGGFRKYYAGRVCSGQEVIDISPVGSGPAVFKFDGWGWVTLTRPDPRNPSQHMLHFPLKTKHSTSLHTCCPAYVPICLIRMRHL